MQLHPWLVSLILFLSARGIQCLNDDDTEDWSQDFDDTHYLTLYLLHKTCKDYPDIPPCNYVNSLEEPRESETITRTKRSAVDDAGFDKKMEAAQNDTGTTGEEGEEQVVNLQQLDQEPRLWKRFGEFRARVVQGEGYKRGPGFRSWGGKRAKFGSWGGKRGEAGKGARFNNWGGKRTKFVSWGGKRSYLDDDSDHEESKISNWEGKTDPFLVPEVDKRKFNSWGGKRTSGEEEELEPEGVDLDKRAPFQSWGVAQSFPYGLENGNTHYYIRRADLNKFMNWGGKRKFSSWGGKRSSDMENGFWNTGDDVEKRKFQSWGGKRDGKTRSRPSFQSWGGKRSERELVARRKRSPRPDHQVPDRSQFFSWGGRR